MKTALEVLDDIEKLIKEYRDSVGKDERELKVLRSMEPEDRNVVRTEWSGRRIASDTLLSRISGYKEAMILDAATADPDNQPLTPADFSRMRDRPP